MSQLCGTSTASSSLATDASVGPASVIVGNLVQGNRLAAAQGRDLGFTDDNKVRIWEVSTRYKHEEARIVFLG